MSDVQSAVQAFLASQAAKTDPGMDGPSAEPVTEKVPRPLRDRVLILEEIAENKIGNLYIPDNSAEAPQYGRVVAIGPGKYVRDQLVKVDVKPGARVAYGKYSGTKLKVGTIEYLVLSEEEVIAEL